MAKTLRFITSQPLIFRQSPELQGLPATMLSGEIVIITADDISYEGFIGRVDSNNRLFISPQSK